MLFLYGDITFVRYFFAFQFIKKTKQKEVPDFFPQRNCDNKSKKNYVNYHAAKK